ncbi:MAG TPA: hypothetical protein VKV21_13340 [Solirubrobacteraceae bacterium]|nr:hypothetical protein [Solirubrobacteraceae bacterium]
MTTTDQQWLAEPLEAQLPDPIIDAADRTDPEHEVLLADAVGLAVLDPDVELRADGGASGLSHQARGSKAVAGQATMWSSRAAFTVRRVRVNGAAGLLALLDGRPFSLGAFTVRAGRIVELDFLVDPERLARLDLRVLED